MKHVLTEVLIVLTRRGGAAAYNHNDFATLAKIQNFISNQYYVETTRRTTSKLDVLQSKEPSEEGACGRKDCGDSHDPAWTA